MRDYDINLLKEIKDKEEIKIIDGIETLVKKVPDDDRENVLDPRVLAIAQKKKDRISGLKKGFSLSNERYRPDKISYDLSNTNIKIEEKLININDDHMIDIFIFTPEKVTEKMPLLIFFHGGGFTAGDMKLYTNQIKYICELSNAVIIFPEYRLAPENPYPKPIEDARGTIKWAIENKDNLNIDINKLMLAGDSAGGSLVNSCLILDEEKYIKKAFEIYPGVDSTTLDNLTAYDWSYEMYPIIDEQKELAYSRIDKIKNHSKGGSEDSLYLQGKVKQNDPIVSIVYAENEILKNLPPITIVYSEYDYLRISEEYFAKRLIEANNKPRVIRYNGCDHGFLDSLGIVVQAEDLCYEIATEINLM